MICCKDNIKNEKNADFYEFYIFFSLYSARNSFYYRKKLVLFNMNHLIISIL